MWLRRDSDVYVDRTMKTFVFWVVLVLTAFLLWQVVRVPKNAQSPEIAYSTFIAKAQAGEIASVSITGTRIEGEYRNGAGRFHLTGPGNPAAFLAILQDKGVEVRFRDDNAPNQPLQLLGTWAPLILLAALWFFMIRQTRRGNPPEGGRGASFGSSGGLG
jgi:cell division protease FtsH